jgi:superoxide dismutase, Fe-Mn family
MFSLPNLPYAYDALEPAMSAKTLHFHHDKHHAAYVKALNELLGQATRPATTLEDVIRQSAGGGPGAAKLFNNAAQAWNHAFFWEAMSPEAARPGAELQAAIQSSFGGIAQLREAFVKEGVAHFGSGWVWLVAEGGKLSVKSTHDAHDIITDSAVSPLIVCDLWEHAYYLDYQNDRKAYLEAWFDALPNWAFAASQLAAANGDGVAWRFAVPTATAEAA